jgi:hypothetical protein
VKVDVTNSNRDIFVLLYDLLNSTRGGWLQSRINWRRQNGVTKHEAVCTCSRTTQCLFRMDSMEHIWNYLHFPCFSRTKIMLMLNLRFVTKAVPQTVCSYILIHMTCHKGQLQTNTNTALSVLIMTSTLEPSWTAGKTFFARRPRHSPVSPDAALYSQIFSRVLYFLATK